MKNKRIIVIGGSTAGPKVAAKSKRMNPNSEILLFTKGDVVSYSACGLPYYLSGVIDDIKKLIIRTPEEFEKDGIQVFLNHTCTKILPNSKEVIVNDKKYSYDDLVLATGGVPVVPRIKNIKLENVFYLRVLSDGVDIKRVMEKAKSVLIIGFGYIALEAAEAFLKNNIKVTVVENHPHIFSFLDREIGDFIKDHVLLTQSNNLNIITNDLVTEFLGDKKFMGAKTRNGHKIEADFCLICAGVRPNVSLAKGCGIDIGVTGAIKVDKKMRTNLPNIWAVGDCAEKHCLVTTLPTHAALGSIANKEGRCCAINLNGGNEQFEGVLGSAVTKFFDYTVGVTGITEHRAREVASKVNIEPISTIVTKHDKARYMPDSNPIKIKLTADRRSGRILGAQGVGLGDVDKRINVITSALQKQMTVRELLNLDLTYAPPTSGAIDPILTACYELQKLIDA